MPTLPRSILAAVFLVVSSACGAPQGPTSRPTAVRPAAAGERVATLAGGCFWCMEPPFEDLPGVRSVISGYAGGSEKNPTYEQVSSGSTGHTETVQITFDPKLVSYADLLEVYWRSMDSTDAGGQFADRGRQYRPAIFVHDAEQRAIAERSKQALAASGRFDKPIVVEITDFSTFYPAEDYHQDYYRKEPARYKAYRRGSGREGFLEKVWAGAPPPAAKRYRKPSDAELRARLDDLQYRVTQQEGTEPPFRNRYWDNKRDGIYVDIVSGEPLFSSKDKFESGTGWPSFTRPLVADNVVTRVDHKLVVPRSEVRSKYGDSHLGHVFDDGPAPTGLRYCMNSAALRFIEAKDLEKEGYGEFAKLFGAGTAQDK